MITLIFDKRSPYFADGSTINMTFVELCIENFINKACDRAKIDGGPIFVNELADLMLIPRKKTGFLYGWSLNPETNAERLRGDISYEATDNEIIIKVVPDGIVIDELED